MRGLKPLSREFSTRSFSPQGLYSVENYRSREEDDGEGNNGGVEVEFNHSGTSTNPQGRDPVRVVQCAAVQGTRPKRNQKSSQGNSGQDCALVASPVRRHI